jgi:hypothetical protein
MNGSSDAAAWVKKFSSAYPHKRHQLAPSKPVTALVLLGALARVLCWASRISMLVGLFFKCQARREITERGKKTLPSR